LKRLFAQVITAEILSGSPYLMIAKQGQPVSSDENVQVKRGKRDSLSTHFPGHDSTKKLLRH